MDYNEEVKKILSGYYNDKPNIIATVSSDGCIKKITKESDGRVRTDFIWKGGDWDTFYGREQ